MHKAMRYARLQAHRSAQATRTIWQEAAVALAKA